MYSRRSLKTLGQTRMYREEPHQDLLSSSGKIGPQKKEGHSPSSVILVVFILFN